jgi:hypothetical protein
MDIAGDFCSAEAAWVSENLKDDSVYKSYKNMHTHE